MAETTINNPQLPPNPTKFYTHFLYKAIFVSIFLLLLPLFPSQAPDFINQKAINTTSWEFLQLVFVGIAVSYGLFSKRNDETHKEDASLKPDNVQSYVAKLLQVPSVFDDHFENTSSTSDQSHDKVQTWNSQYYRGEPIIVVANDNDDAAMIEKPLVLPVRSLKTKTGVFESSVIDSNSNSNSISFTRSNSKHISRNVRRSTPDETESEENIVLRSPVPWRSRSGRMEVKEDSSSQNNTPSFRSQSFNNAKTHHPPPPPPPPPPTQRPTNVNYTRNRIKTYDIRNELKRSVRSAPEDFDQNRISRSETITKGRSFNTRNESEGEQYLSNEKEIERFIERRGSQRKKFMDEEIEHPNEIKNPKEVKKELQRSYDGSEDEGGGSMKDGDEVVESDNGPDVDKKADEFIAKFREQIRLQRIASIRKSTTQR